MAADISGWSEFVVPSARKFQGNTALTLQIFADDARIQPAGSDWKP
jgi:hypothetical protein